MLEWSGESVGGRSADVTEGDKRGFGGGGALRRYWLRAGGARTPRDLYRPQEKPGKPAESALRWRCLENKRLLAYCIVIQVPK